jgi:hypothetical protein
MTMLTLEGPNGEPIAAKSDADGLLRVVVDGGGGGDEVKQGAGNVTSPWGVVGVNTGVAERLATRADQVLGNNLLDSIDIKIPADPSTATNQATANGHLATIVTNTGNALTDVQLRANPVPVINSNVSFTAAGSVVAAQNATIKASAGRLLGFRVRGVAAGTYFLQWHDVASTGALAIGTQRGLGFEIAGAGDDFAFTFPSPISFAIGITWALSTTVNSYAAAAGKTAYVDPVWE